MQPGICYGDTHSAASPAFESGDGVLAATPAGTGDDTAMLACSVSASPPVPIGLGLESADLTCLLEMALARLASAGGGVLDMPPSPPLVHAPHMDAAIAPLVPASAVAAAEAADEGTLAAFVASIKK